jgi:hypothetical protein
MQSVPFYCGGQFYRGGQFYCGGQLYRGGQFYWWRKPEYPEKTKDPEFFMQGGNYYYNFIFFKSAFSENSIKKGPPR